jgi:hypothetical protein
MFTSILTVNTIVDRVTYGQNESLYASSAYGAQQAYYYHNHKEHCYAFRLVHSMPADHILR